MGTIFEDFADAVSSAADWTTHAISDVVDQLKVVPGLGAVVGLVQDFGNTAVGKIFFSLVAPGMLTTLFSSLPGVGLEVAQALSNPVLQQMLPGLVRGERVDKAFIASAKTVVNRIISSGGASAQAQQFLGDGVKLLTDELKASGFDVDNAQALVKKGVDMGTDYKERAEALLGPQLSQLAAKYLIPEDVLRVSLDGILRKQMYEAWLYTVDTGERILDADELATSAQTWVQNTVDAWLTAPHLDVVNVSGGIPTFGPVHFLTAGQVFALTQGTTPDGEYGPALFGGAMGLVTLDYVYSRLHAMASLGRRPDEVQALHAFQSSMQTSLSRFASDQAVAKRVRSAVSLGPVSAAVVQTSDGAPVYAASASLAPASSHRTVYVAAGGAALLLAAALLLSPRKGS